MITKIAAFAVTFLLVGVTVAFAGPPASANLDDTNEIALSQAAPPLYLPTSEATSAFLKQDSHAGPAASQNLDDATEIASSQAASALYIPQSVSTPAVPQQDNLDRRPQSF